jgi:3-dehydroquinate dehydratase-2
VSRILVLHGPNLDLLGEREPDVYGAVDLATIAARLRRRAGELGVEVRIEQSNHEGTLVDILASERGRSQACIVNPGGLSHTSVVLLDALRAFPGLVVEVHLSNPSRREPYRRVLLTAEAADGVISGFGALGYELALEAAARLVREPVQDGDTVEERG